LKQHGNLNKRIAKEKGKITKEKYSTQ